MAKTFFGGEFVSCANKAGCTSYAENQGNGAQRSDDF
jgi:hypothetical protein